MSERDGLDIEIRLRTLSVDKLDENTNRNTPVTFRVNVKFDESSRKLEETDVDFGITVTTEPNIARFGVEGIAIVKGKAEEIEQVFATSSDSKIPNLLFEIYDRLYTAIYVASTILDIPCPSPLLLKSGIQGEKVAEAAQVEKPVIGGSEAGVAGVAGVAAGASAVIGAVAPSSPAPSSPEPTGPTS